MTIEDICKGSPSNFDIHSAHQTLGLQLIETLSKQLEDDYSYDSLQSGTLFNLQFKRDKEKKGIGNALLN